MNKMGKRFMALIIIFASIISFLPVQIGQNGKAANAYDSTATDIEVGRDVYNGETVDSSRKPIYSTKSQSSYFTITVKDIAVKNTDLITKLNEPTVTKQEVIIKSINRIRLDDPSTYSANMQILSDMGLTIGTSTDTDNKRIGAKITGLPLGINEIEYSVKVTETTRILNADTTTVLDDTKLITNTSENDAKKINIENGNSFVQSQIPYIEFVDYVQGRLADADLNSENNVAPFKYTQQVQSQEGKSLKFEHSLPNSVTDMDYKIAFNGTLDITAAEPKNDIVFINGVKQSGSDLSVSDDKKVLKGSLEKTATSTIILISIRHESAIKNTYAIEISYDNKAAANDYLLKDAGIKKLNYDQDSRVKAFIGKEFTTETEGGVPVYKGKITIDKKAEMIAMEPTIGRPSSMTAFKITNHYNNDGSVEKSRIINGQSVPYVDFDMEGTSNQIQLEVYEGDAGNVKEGTLPLAIYKLDVVLVGSESGEVKFGFGDNSYLTQPGRGKENDPTKYKIDFSSERRSYDLNFTDAASDGTVKAEITLDEPNTNDAVLNKRREYIKAWSGTNTQSDNVSEITGLGQNSTVNIDIPKEWTKIIVQAYYDEVVYEKNTDGTYKTDADGNYVEESRKPYPIGEKYTFYIPLHPDPQDNTSTKSTDASLSNMKVGNGTIKAADGTSIFSSDKTDYIATVPKIDTISAVTATATSSKVKDITATIAETGDEYNLISGQAFDFPLNSSGKTTIKIVITAEDGVTKKTYNLTINNDTRSATTALKNVVTDKGEFTFDPDKDPNKIRVDQAVNTLKVSPVPEDAKSRVTVNGTKYTGTPISIDLRGSQETDMEIKVTAEDGSTSKTYYFEIYRTDSPIPNDEDDDVDDVFFDEIDDTWVDLSKYEEWGTVDGKTVYFNNKGRQVKNQWVNTKGIWYYLDSKGYKATGWRKEVGGKTYYLDPNTGAVKTGWLNQNNKWYYLGLNGVMQKGWLNLNGHWYYFTPEGEMITNQSMYIDDGVYRFASDGIMY